MRPPPLLLPLLLALTWPSGAFEIYWNAPSFMCRKYGLEFERAARRFGLLQNRGDEFVGERISILYDPGAFPALLRAKDEELLVRNGGVPQEGDLRLHLRLLDEQLARLPANFSGLGVLDMESWRPVFRQNWAALQPYRNYSLELERRRAPWRPAGKLREEARRRFEAGARDFMRASLRRAERARPRAAFGYYAYPYCFNPQPDQPSDQCAPQVQRENDQMRWLFEGASALYPSVYLQQRLSAEQRLGMARGRVREAARVANFSSPPARLFVYFWFKYQDRRDSYVHERDVEDAVAEIAAGGADGLVLWGSSADFDDRGKCEAFADHLQRSLGPALERARARARAGRPPPRVPRRKSL